MKKLNQDSHARTRANEEGHKQKDRERGGGACVRMRLRALIDTHTHKRTHAQQHIYTWTRATTKMHIPTYSFI